MVKCAKCNSVLSKQFRKCLFLAVSLFFVYLNIFPALSSRKYKYQRTCSTTSRTHPATTDTYCVHTMKHCFLRPSKSKSHVAFTATCWRKLCILSAQIATSVKSHILRVWMLIRTFRTESEKKPLCIYESSDFLFYFIFFIALIGNIVP